MIPKKEKELKEILDKIPYIELEDGDEQGKGYIVG